MFPETTEYCQDHINNPNIADKDGCTKCRFSRSRYLRQMEFFKKGAKHRQRVFEAANRIGKSEAGAYEVALHATGKYPDWWEGRRFDHPINIIVAATKADKTKEVPQAKLLGEPGELGTGMIPLEDIEGKPPTKPGIPEGIMSIRVKHQTNGIPDGVSHIYLKSCEEGRVGFEGTTNELIWLDEEPPYPVFEECLTRTATTGGSLILTFTPLKGLSKTVLTFMPNGQVVHDENSPKALIRAGWGDVPHLTTEMKKELIASFDPTTIEARTKGLPQLGVGAIYPIPESEILVAPFRIPDYYECWYGLDYGWNMTAAVFFARDPSTDIIYLYAEYARAKAELPVHVAALQALGANWMMGASESALINSRDGERMLALYQEAGLMIEPADKAVDAGINKVWQYLSCGKLRVFESCQAWLSEFRTYHRDEDGKVVKQRDDLMDATRYGIMSGECLAAPKPDEYDEDNTFKYGSATKDPYTGY